MRHVRASRGIAVVAAVLPDADPLHKVTIIPRGRALGVTMQLPEADRYTHSKPFIEAQISILMGGRVAEELFLRQMTSGAPTTSSARRNWRARWCASLVCPRSVHCTSAAPRAPGMQTTARPASARKPRAAWTRRLRVRDARLRNRSSDHRGAARSAVKVVAEELLDVESIDADRLKELLADRSRQQPSPSIFQALSKRR